MNGYTNGVIAIYGFNDSSNYISLRDLQNISIENVETRYTLGYCGYSYLGAYLVQTVWEKYYCRGTKLVDFSKEAFKEWFIGEVVKAIEDTNSRISKKNKKKKVADKINDIENEIDLKIMDLVDSLASKGVKLQNANRMKYAVLLFAFTAVKKDDKNSWQLILWQVRPKGTASHNRV